MSTAPLRIVHVVHSLGTGGMENGVVNVARILSETRQATVGVICLTRAGAMAERLPDGDRVVALHKPEGLHLGWSLRLARAVSDLGGADVLHTHNLGPLIYVTAARVWGLRTPVLHGEHAVLTPAESTARERWRRRWLYRRAQLLHTVSGDMTRQLQALSLAVRPVRTVLNGVDGGRFSPGGPRPAHAGPSAWPTDAIVVLMVARFGEFKGHERLLDAWPAVLQRVPNARLVLVGSGGPREAAVLARLAESTIAATVWHAGHQDDPAPWYRAASVLILPSTNEGLSNVTLEAMACGCPVLSQPSAGAAEIITDGVDGLIRSLDSPETLARNLGDLLATGPDRLRHLGQAARATIDRHWSLDRMVAAYLACYRELTAEAQRARR